MLDSPRHQCLIYEGAPSPYLERICQSIIQRLKANYRCVYLNSPPMVAGMRSALAAAGIDVKAQTGRGALRLSSDQGHLVDGRFDVSAMLGLLSDLLRQALAEGYAGLWASGDMTWEFGSEKNLEKLFEYERRLGEFMQRNPAMAGVCQYHRDTLPPHAIDTALSTHSAVYINAGSWQSNPRYRRHADEIV